MKYKLVNPFISGNFNDTFEGANSLEAANAAYSSLSQFFNNNVPKFYFSLEGNNELTHYQVQETKQGDRAEFSITEYKVDAKYNAKLRSQLVKFKEEQRGGKRDEDSSSSSSDSSSDSSSWLEDSSTTDYRYKTDPIVYWWYYPSVYRLRKIFVPTFVQSVTPYISVYLYN